MQTQEHETRGPRPTSVGTVLRWTIAALMLGSGAIHFGMMGEHAGVSWTHGLFFASVAWLQLALAAMIGFRPTTPVITLGIVLNLGTLTVWVHQRTVGIAIGGDGTPDAWGSTDILCAVFEGLAVVASFGLLSKSISRRPLSSSIGFAGVGVVLVAVAVLTSMIFSPAVTTVSASGVSADGHNHGAATVSADGHNHSHAAIPGSGGLIDTGNGLIVTGALTGDSPCEKLGPAGLGGPDGEGRRGPRPPRSARTSTRSRRPSASSCAGSRRRPARSPTSTRPSPTPRPPATASRRATCRASARTTRTSALVAKFDPAAPSELLYDGTPPTQDRRPELPRVPPGRPARGLRRPERPCGTSTTSTAASASNEQGVVVGDESHDRRTSARRAAARRSRSPTSGWCTTGSCPGWECSWGVFAGECPELGGRIGGTAFDKPDPKAFAKALGPGASVKAKCRAQLVGLRRSPTGLSARVR